MENTNQNTPSGIIVPLENQELQQLLQEEDFYFQKAQDALKAWLEYPVSPSLAQHLLEIRKDYHGLQREAKDSPEVSDILKMVYRVIAYCDTNAKEKAFYNKYEDKRVLAKAGVRMAAWVSKLLLYKFNRAGGEPGSVLNAINYLLNPEHNATILSENHRRLVAQSVLQTEYNPATFTDDLKGFFSSTGLQTSNPLNYTHLLTRILYENAALWKDEVIGLMASDSTSWQEDVIDAWADHDACIIWNSARPVGGKATISGLHALLANGGSFPLYYSVKREVCYKATIVDFALDQAELDQKSWNGQCNILGYEGVFEDYADDRKSARIVFLASAIEAIKPVPIDDFRFYNGSSAPVHHNMVPIKYEPEENIHVIPSRPPEKKNNASMSANQILFGPPGTGKTFATTSLALEVLGEQVHDKSRGEIRSRFNELVKDGQIVFTTFHQSMAYEDFIEGLKPIEPVQEGGRVIYKTVDGIFKQIASEARKASVSQKAKEERTGSAPFDLLFNKLKEAVEEALLQDPVHEENQKRRGLVIDLQTSFFSITGISGLSIKMMTRTGNEQNTMTRPTLERCYEKPEAIDQIVIGGMKTYYKALVQWMKRLEGTVQDEVQNTEAKDYVIIIDEINRGNVSQIFGELITLIEDDKRLGKEEALEVTLPYSKERFGVPDNLHIIGTMNTADRSVEALDTALRRRFSFIEMPPIEDHDAIATAVQIGTGDPINFQTVLQTINKRLEKLVGRDHRIGHSYFLGDKNWEGYLHAFTDKIIPLLQEYFYGDWSRMCLVLGQGFVKLKETEAKENFFAALPAKTDSADAISDLQAKESWELVRFDTPDSDREEKFGNALRVLLGLLKPGSATTTTNPQPVES